MGDILSVYRCLTPYYNIAQRHDKNNAKGKKKALAVARASFLMLCPTYLASFFSKNFLYLLLNLSTRPALSTSFILPV